MQVQRQPVDALIVPEGESRAQLRQAGPPEDDARQQGDHQAQAEPADESFAPAPQQ